MLVAHSGQMNREAQPSVSLPFVVGASQAANNLFTAVASSDWAFQQTANSGDSGLFNLSVYIGSPVEGVLVIERPEAFKSVQYLTDLGSARYSLAEVLTVAVTKADGQFIASEPHRGWYGYGDSEDFAIGSFASSLVEELEGLSEREAQLSDRLRERLGQLRSVVIPKR